MLCRDCLSRLSEKAGSTAGRVFNFMLTSFQGIFGFLLMWVVFFWIGRMLLAIPDSFHEGTIWQTGWWKLP